MVIFKNGPPEKKLNVQLFSRKEEFEEFHRNFGDTRMKEDMKDIFRRASTVAPRQRTSTGEVSAWGRGASD